LSAEAEELEEASLVFVPAGAAPPPPPAIILENIDMFKAEVAFFHSQASAIYTS
jgi:hypothetical protein